MQEIEEGQVWKSKSGGVKWEVTHISDDPIDPDVAVSLLRLPRTGNMHRDNKNISKDTLRTYYELQDEI